HSNHGVRLAVQDQVAADNISVRRIPAPPQGIAENGKVHLLFGVEKCSANGGTGAKDLEKAGRDLGAEERLSSQIEVAPLVGCRALERAAAVAEQSEARARHKSAGFHKRRDLVNADQITGILKSRRERQRADSDGKADRDTCQKRADSGIDRLMQSQPDRVRERSQTAAEQPTSMRLRPQFRPPLPL